MLLPGCAENRQEASYEKVSKDASSRKPYIPHNAVEFNNYTEAQKLYDSPTTIIWCTAFSQNATAPLITVPIAGKLTSSTTTYFSPEEVDSDGVVTAARSVDGLYHPNPPPYRYGFTPGGQYVDFFNMPTLCTTKPLAFQRQSVSIAVDDGLSGATGRAEAALKRGDKAQAQAILESAAP